MRGSCVILIVALGVTLAPQCQAFSLDFLKPAIASKVGDLWENGDIEILGHFCNYQVKPTFKSWELYFIGSLWCPGWTPIRGTAETRSRSGVVGKTTQDFMRKALKAGLVTQEEAQQWIN